MKYRIVSQKLSPLMMEVAKKACHLLGIDDNRPSVVFFEPIPGQNPEDDTTEKTRFKDVPMTGPAGLKGTCSFVDDYVWVRAGLDEKERSITIAHELYHFRAFQKGFFTHDESEAEKFGRMIWDQVTGQEQRNFLIQEYKPQEKRKSKDEIIKELEADLAQYNRQSNPKK